MSNKLSYKLAILTCSLSALWRVRASQSRLCTYRPIQYTPVCSRRHRSSKPRSEERVPDMTWSSTVHTTLSTDTEPSIIITFNDAKYIFNASENSCRAFLQNSNWRKARAMFFTQAKVEQTSGLTGIWNFHFIFSTGADLRNRVDYVLCWCYHRQPVTVWTAGLDTHTSQFTFLHIPVLSTFTALKLSF